MLLANSVQWRGRRHAMAGVLPVDVDVLDSPQGHGYAVLRVDRPNLFFAVGDEIRGHEFHYSRIAGPLPGTACAVVRGTGCGDGRDAIVANGVWASYVHVHAAGVPAWADGMMRAACAYRIDAGDTSMSANSRRRWPHPIFLGLDEQPVVVVGGGTIGERKIAVAAGVRRARHADQPRSDRAAGRPRRRRRDHAASAGLPGRRPGRGRLAYAATSDREVNRAVRDEAQALGIWFNAVDQPDLCDFITPATVRRGDLTLAISTNGRCPALAKDIRRQLERRSGLSSRRLVERMGRRGTASANTRTARSRRRPGLCTWSAPGPATRIC